MKRKPKVEKPTKPTKPVLTESESWEQWRRRMIVETDERAAILRKSRDLGMKETNDILLK